MSIQVVSRAPALVAEMPVFKGVDVGDVRLRGQTLEQGVVAILVVGAELLEHQYAPHLSKECLYLQGVRGSVSQM
jgi:hypothetical protein